MRIDMVPVPEPRPSILLLLIIILRTSTILIMIIPQRIPHKLNPRRRIRDKNQIKMIRISVEEAQRAQADVVDAPGRELRRGRVRVRVAEEVGG